MRNTALTPKQVFLESPMQAPELMDLLLPSVHQQVRVSELLEWLMSDDCDATVNVPARPPEGLQGKGVAQEVRPGTAQFPMHLDSVNPANK